MSETEKKTLSDYVGAAILKYRVVILSFLAVLIGAALIAGIVLSLLSAQKKSGLAAVDALQFRLEKVQKEEQTAEAQITEILNGFNELVKKSAGVVRVRAAMAAADIDFDRKNWEESRTNWVLAAETQKKSYTAAICFYNAAVCSEELGDFDNAVAYFDKASQAEGFPLASKAMFNAARIEDQRMNYQAAAERYQKLNDTHSGTDWANLGKSRIIALRAEGKIQ